MREPNLPHFTRRIFLHRTLQSLGALAVLPLTNVLAAEATTAESATTEGLKFLTAEELAVLESVGDTYIPRGGAFEIGARDLGLARHIDGNLPKMDPDVATGFRGALAFVEQQAPGLAGKEAPFSALSEDDRAAVLSAMLKAGGLPAGIFLAMKYLCVNYFYTMDDTWKYTGYDGPML